MCYKFDIDWDSMPFSFSLVDEVDSRYNQWWADNLPKMLAQLRQHFSDDGIDEKELLQGFEEFKRKYCEQRGHRLAPTPTGAKIIKLVYDEITSYREMTEIMGDLEYEVKKLPELYSIYEALHSIIDIYDNYCLDLDEILAPSPSQTETTITPNDCSASDIEELGSYFTADFRGYRGGDDIFSTMIEDAMKLPTQKELGMLAYLLYNSRVLNRHKPRSFSKWIRTFFTLLGKTPPLDTHMNKYEPDEKILRIFAYVT